MTAAGRSNRPDWRAGSLSTRGAVAGLSSSFRLSVLVAWLSFGLHGPGAVGRERLKGGPNHRASGNGANHRDPVRTVHLPDGKPRSVAKARTAARGRASDSREIP